MEIQEALDAGIEELAACTGAMEEKQEADEAKEGVDHERRRPEQHDDDAAVAGA